MRILDDITGKIIEDDDCVEINFHPHSIKRNCPTLHKTFQNEKFYVSVKIAEEIIIMLKNLHNTSSLISKE